MNNFYLIVIVVMIAVAIIALLLLGGVIPGLAPGGGGGGLVNLNMWGDIPADNLVNLINNVNGANNKSFNIIYTEKSSAVYEKELIDALASGKGPDIWLLSQDLILKHKDKVSLIPFESLSERDFKDAFIEEGELYLSETGIVGFPFSVDPIVLYWNRNLFAGAGISQPPKTWDEFVGFSEKLTVRDSAGNITTSGAALGEFQNVDHAKEIISLLVLQTGNPIIESSSLKSTFVPLGNATIQSGENAVRFFTEFSNPSKISYSWNKSMSDSKDAFIAGVLAMYLGYASDYNDIISKNSHLNFDVAEIPQIKDGKIRATFAGMKALVVSKNSLNAAQAMLAASKLIEGGSIAEFSEKTFLPPVRRDLLVQAPKDPALNVFYKSAVYSRAWLEPDPAAVSEMFRSMIDVVNTGKKRISDAASDVNAKLDIMLKDIEKK